MMQNPYYTLPLDLELLTQKKQHPRCSLKESIYQHIYLILTTFTHENRFDETFGCDIWDNDFEINTGILWRDQMRQSITRAVTTHERRLMNISVKIETEEVQTQHNGSPRIRKRLGVWVEGFTRQTNERFEFFESIFISPLALD